MYRWQGAVQSDEEYLVLFTTRAAVAERFEHELAELHTYDVPRSCRSRSSTAAGRTTTLTSSANPSNPGEPVTCTATPSGDLRRRHAPGTVQFRFEGDHLGEPVALVDGVATAPATSNINVGEHPIVAEYSGDDRFAAN